MHPSILVTASMQATEPPSTHTPTTRVPPHLIGNEAARQKLRAALVEHIHSRPPPAPTGYHHWTVPANACATVSPVRLLVGDPVVLAVSLFEI